MENKMKKLMFIAALGAAALFTACGDDSSSSGGTADGCSVKDSEKSVTVTYSEAGYTTVYTYTLTEKGYTMKTEAEGFDTTENEIPAEGTTIDDLKEIGNNWCKTLEKGQTVAK